MPARLTRLRGHPSVLLGGDQLVSEAGDRDDQLGMGGIAFDLPSERRYVSVARAFVPDVAALPEMLHDLAPCEDPSGLFCEQCEQLVFRRSECDLLAFGNHLVFDDVEAQAAQPAYRHVA